MEPEFVRLVRPEPIVCADSILNVAFERRDPEQMRRFLEDFGFLLVERRAQTLYFRGHGTEPYLVSVTESSQDGIRGFAFAAREAADLTRLAQATGQMIDTVADVGGGRRVRLSDPDGLVVDFVHGFEPARSMPVPKSRPLLNTPFQKERVNATVRSTTQPSPLFKLGHIVLQRPDFQRASQWYMRHFGLIPSDVQCLPDGQPALGFFRLDRGATPADHHTLGLLGGPATKLLHVSFETLDLESVGQGNQHLRARGWTHYWGIGRHILGSQVFDYWKDPAGDEWEHYSDGDVMTAEYPTGYSPLTRGGLWAWGDDLPDDLRPPISPEDVEKIHAAGGFGSMDLQQVKGLMQALSVQPRPWMR
jgi:catechol 2,3-dioxygenase-like lactoylglutathione lyase family enzyme